MAVAKRQGREKPAKIEQTQAKSRLEGNTFGVKSNQLQMSYNISIALIDQTKTSLCVPDNQD